jgi:hypothetical protein
MRGARSSITTPLSDSSFLATPTIASQPISNMEELAALLERHAVVVRRFTSALSGFKAATSADIDTLKVTLEESSRERNIGFDEIKAKLDDFIDHFGVKRREPAGGEAGSADP